MGSTPSPPPVPSYQQVSGQPSQTAAANYSQAADNYNIRNPFGSESFISGTDPATGAPMYTIQQNYTPQQQQILAGQQSGQIGAATAAGDFGGTLANLFGNGMPNVVGDSNSLTSQLENPVISNLWNTTMQYQQPQLDAELQSRGIMPGTPAYTQQMAQLTNQQISSFGSVNAQFQPQAFNEATTADVQLPLGIEGSLLGMSNPAALPNSAGMGAQQQAPNVVGAATAQEQAQAQEYQAQLQANAAQTAGIAGSIGGLLKLPTGGGSSVGGAMLAGLFA